MFAVSVTVLFTPNLLVTVVPLPPFMVKPLVAVIESPRKSLAVISPVVTIVFEPNPFVRKSAT